MFSLKGRFAARPGLRIRPVPEWDACVVYDPDRRRLSELDLVSWLVLESCDGCSYHGLRSSIRAALGSRLDEEEADRLLAAAVMRLIAAGLVSRRAGDGKRAWNGEGEHGQAGQDERTEWDGRTGRE